MMNGIKKSSNSERTGSARDRRIAEAILAAALTKGTVLLVSLFSVPITVRYLGADQFGLWTTISTTITLLMVLDVGIANTLTNLISEAYAQDNKELAGHYSATAFWMMLLVTCVLGLVGWVAWPFINWGSVFHLKDPNLQLEASKAIAVAYGVFLLGLPAGLAAKLLGGYQEVRIANIFAAGGSILSLLMIILVVRQHGSLADLIGGYSGAMVAGGVLCLLWVWIWHKPWLAPRVSKITVTGAKKLMRSGGQFFVIQLAGLVVFNSDNLVIAHYLSPAAVTPYSVTWRLVGYAAALQTLMTPALWPAYAEAYARGDIEWVRKTYWRVMISTMAVTTIFCAIFIVFGRVIILHWAGSVAVPPQHLIWMMSFWVLLSTLMNNESCLLVAASETKLQAWASAASAIVNLALSIWLVQRIGAGGVILGTILSYILVLVGPQTWKVKQILNARRGFLSHHNSLSQQRLNSR
jgi:O-antigen/teichoic acid export membrane protein